MVPAAPIVVLNVVLNVVLPVALNVVLPVALNVVLNVARIAVPIGAPVPAA